MSWKFCNGNVILFLYSEVVPCFLGWWWVYYCATSFFSFSAFLFLTTWFLKTGNTKLTWMLTFLDLSCFSLSPIVIQIWMLVSNDFDLLNLHGRSTMKDGKIFIFKIAGSRSPECMFLKVMLDYARGKLDRIKGNQIWRLYCFSKLYAFAKKVPVDPTHWSCFACKFSIFFNLEAKNLRPIFSMFLSIWPLPCAGNIEIFENCFFFNHWSLKLKSFFCFHIFVTAIPCAAHKPWYNKFYDNPVIFFSWCLLAFTYFSRIYAPWRKIGSCLIGTATRIREPCGAIWVIADVIRLVFLFCFFPSYWFR